MIPIISKSSTDIVVKLGEFFDVVGYPTIIRADNNPFNSRDVRNWAQEYNIQLKFSSPRYPQSNGLAEKGVAIAKNILKRSIESKGNFQHNVLEYNTTPVASLGFTPSELFFGRKLKSRFPVSESALVRRVIPEEMVVKRLVERRVKQKLQFDCSAKELVGLKKVDSVIFRKNVNEWELGMVVDRVNERSYIVKTSYGKHFRRNRRLIRPSCNYSNVTQVQDDMYYDIDDPDVLQDHGQLLNNDVEEDQADISGDEDVNMEQVPLSNEVNRGEDMDVVEGSSYVTRSGREVVAPYKYKDYELNID